MALKNVFRSSLKLNNNFLNLNLLHVQSKVKVNSHFGVSKRRLLHTCSPLLKKLEVSIIINREGEEIHTKGKEGDSILDVITKNEIDLPGYGACEGTLSCSTCHVKLSPDDFAKIPEKASDEELDMLDLAPDVCATSRLGCQIYLCKKLEGLKVNVPSEVKDMREFPVVSSANTAE